MVRPMTHRQANRREAFDGPADDAPEPNAGSFSARARAAATREAAYMAGLNPEQREAVEATEGPVLVLAGAGTGKTRVLTTRIAHLIATGKARPFDILAVTFTNKAAREMKERVGALVGAVAEGMPWLGTFHSIGTKVLRRHAELVGLKSDFTILGVDDQLRLMKQVIEAADIDEKRWPARQLAAQIDGWKNRGLDPAHVPRQPRGARPVPEPLPLHAGRRVPGHERRPVPVAAAPRADAEEPVLRRRRRPVDLWLARRRGRQHPALRARLPGRQGHPARAQLPLDRPHPRRRLDPHRQEPGPARQDAAHRGRRRREGHRHRRLGFGGGGAR